MKSHLNEFDAAIEQYLGRLASESLETQTRQSEGVRIHYQTPGAGLALPAGQAAATGAFIGLAVLAIAYLAGWPKPWAWGLLTWLLVQAAAWLWLLLGWRGVVLNRLEQMTQHDLNKDNFIGPPITSNVRIELSENGGQTTRFINLPGSEEQIAGLARGLLEGLSFTEAAWTGAGRPFTRSQFVAVRDEMIRRGLARWHNPGSPARGASLTNKGRAIMKQLSSQPPHPLEDDPESV